MRIKFTLLLTLILIVFQAHSYASSPFKQTQSEGPELDALTKQAIKYYVGSESEKEKSAVLLEEAMGKGSVYATRLLAMAYVRGSGVEKNNKKAFDLFKNAAKLGDDISVMLVGTNYLNGNSDFGIQEDVEEAKKWFRIGSDHGISESTGTLASIIYGGHGNSQAVPEEGVRLFQLAAEQGQLSSKVMLAIFYHGGITVEKDLQKCYEYTIDAKQQASLPGSGTTDKLNSQIKQLLQKCAP